MASFRSACVSLLALASFMAAGPVHAADLNDYPTSARADYVFACMKANGETYQVLQQCSCSIDIVASILPYEKYVGAETVLSLSQVPGRFGAMFRSPEEAKAAVTRSEEHTSELQSRP